MKTILKKNQLAILVIALMLVTAGYLNHTSNTTEISSNGIDFAAIGDATLVNSGELIEENDKQIIINAIQNASSINDENLEKNTIIDESSIQTNIESEEDDDYFTSSKLQRDKMYSQMLEIYQKILENSNISQEQKAISEQEIAKINQTKNAIMIAENLISTKDFKDSVIFVNDTSVSVVVDADNLETEQIAQIQNIISRELKVDVGNIHISNK